ncbi:magnesium/cobalt transporter CorA [Chitinibacteraceae bacterium HSL-7]
MRAVCQRPSDRGAVMLSAFALTDGRLRQIPVERAADLAHPNVIWVDLVDPSDDERELVQAVFRVELPEDEELEDIEESARCYADHAGLHLNSYFLHQDSDGADNVTVSFHLHGKRLLTMRQEELAVFRLFRLRARVQSGFVANAAEILLGIYSVAIEYDADVLEGIYTALEEASQTVLKRSEEIRDETLGEILAHIAQQEDINGKVRIDLMDTRRALSFLLRSRALEHSQESDVREILRDLESLNNHTGFLFEKINFLMDAVMGLINLAQNKIIKIFSIASVVFLPPTLVASIYGMNFANMPELNQSWGYPTALVLMVLSGIAPYWFFKRKGWL